MEDLQQIMVGDHIDDLYREGDALRAERLERDHSPGPHGVRLDVPTRSGRSPARVRVGRWLIGVGSAVAGTSGDPQGGTAGHAA
jgi:hypothetical protein